MTTLTLGKVKLVNKGAWSSTATYSKGDIVQYNGVSYVYKNETSKSYTALFFGPLSSFPISGTVSSMTAQSDTFTITWTSALPTTLDSRIVAGADLYAYSKWLEPDSKIVSVTNNSTTTSTIRVSKKITSTSNLGSHSVTIGPRRIGNRYEVSLNNVDWDELSENFVFAGEWSISTNYLPGQIVARHDNSYLCTQGNYGVDPLFDFIGCWEPYLIGDEALPHERIVCGINGNPMGWRGHPYVPNPVWGGNAYTNIPWNLPTSHRTTGLAEYWAPQWNTANCRSFMNYRGALTLGSDGRGHRIGKGYGYYGTGAPGQSDSYRSFAGELAAEFRNQFLNDEMPHYGNKSFAENFRKSSKPMPMQNMHQWTTIATLLSDGSVLVGGTSSSSSLGNGEDSDYTSPLVQLPYSSFGQRRVVKLAGGNSHSRNSAVWYMALDEYGEVWTWGYNGYGQCGIGPENHLNTGMRIANRTDNVRSPMCLEKDIFFEGQRIVDIYSMENSAFALDEAGQLWAWGRNNYGQLGYSTASFASTSQSAAPYKINVNWSSYGGIQKIITPSYENNEWLCILDGQGHVWNCGYNGQGQLGTGNTTNDGTTSTIRRTSSTAGWSIGGGIKNIWAAVGGINLTYFLDTSLNLWATGSGSSYVFGSASNSDRTTPAQMYGPGGAMTNIVSIACTGRAGGNSQVALDHNGITYGAGWNGYGAAGVGMTSNVGNNNVYTQDVGTSSTNAGWGRVLMPSNIYQSGNKVVDIWGYGDYDATTSHLEAMYWLTERGEILYAGRNYYYSGNNDGNSTAPRTMTNFM